MSPAFNFWKKYLRIHWPWYLIGAICVAGTNLMQVLVAKNYGLLVDFFMKKNVPEILAGPNRAQSFYLLFIYCFGCFFFLMAFRMGWRRTLGRRSHYASSELRDFIWEKAHRLKLSSFIGHFSKGKIMSLANSDVNSARFIFGFTLIAAMDVLFLGAMTLTSMVFISVPITLWALGILIYLPWAMKWLSQRELGLYETAQKSLGVLNDYVAQLVSTVKLQKLAMGSNFWQGQLNSSAEIYRKKRLKVNTAGLIYIPAIGISSIFSYIILFALGIRYVFNGDITVGEFMAMQGLIFLLQDPLLEIGFIISEFRKGMKSLERIVELDHSEIDHNLKAFPETAIEKNSHESPWAIDIQGLDFRYPGLNRPLFCGYNFRVKPGEILGITGPIGAGKSTLLRIIGRLEDPKDMDFRLFSRPIQSYSHKELRKWVTIVSQVPFLFATTIKENLGLSFDLTDEEAYFYLEMVGLDHDIKNFPDGLYTYLGEWGVNLSGGQKQRLTIARAICWAAKSPDQSILLLDDCLSAVDVHTEEMIVKNLETHLKNKTVIWVAHRPSALKLCDRVLEL